MKKLYVLFIIALSGFCFAETGSVAAGSVSTTFTNDAPQGIVYIHNAAVKMATAVNDTFSILVTKGSVDYQIATISVTTNSVYGNVVVTNPVPIAKDGTFKISRTKTNYAASVYIDIR